MPPVPLRPLAAVLFDPEDGDYYQCRLCFLHRKQAGYTDLVEHFTRCHTATHEDEFRTIQRREGSLDAFVKGGVFRGTSTTGWTGSSWITGANRVREGKEAYVHAPQPQQREAAEEEHVFARRRCAIDRPEAAVGKESWLCNRHMD
ncbi:hypothetical protein GN958_ATG09320 [Phytophthora infestans]|uniref:BED-type domain-containing protein n=1 Tax=Phytophthora infestans TaxID=4787 RepID=A0A8S9UKN3_PHYIN|nr:hypothetical protein GN958_ATG09320 [Phytophthora infestans]